MKCNHQHNLDYSEEYDAYYCKICNVWKERKCKDKNCIFCSERPKKPLLEVDKLGNKKEGDKV